MLREDARANLENCKYSEVQLGAVSYGGHSFKGYMTDNVDSSE